MIYINNCKLLIIIGAKILKNINYSIILTAPTIPSLQNLQVSPPKIPHPSHLSHPCPCGSHPTARTPSLPVRLAPLRVSPSLSEFFFKKYFPHYQRIIKNFQKKLRKNLQDKKNAVPLHPQMRRIAALRKRKTTRTLT